MHLMYLNMKELIVIIKLSELRKKVKDKPFRYVYAQDIVESLDGVMSESSVYRALNKMISCSAIRRDGKYGYRIGDVEYLKSELKTFLE